MNQKANKPILFRDFVEISINYIKQLYDDDQLTTFANTGLNYKSVFNIYIYIYAIYFNNNNKTIWTHH